MTLIDQYPSLFKKVKWGEAQSQFSLELPPEPLISNVNIVPFIGELCVLVQLENGVWEMPGGTLEPGEHYMDAIKRELLEEAGSQLVTFKPFGAWRYDSQAKQPYRPHLPFPEFYRLVGYGQVERITTPQIPEDGGERVRLVETMPVEQAAAIFRDTDRADLAELYLLADSLRRSEGEFNMYAIGRCMDDDVAAVVQLSVQWAGENNVYGLTANDPEDLKARTNSYFWIARANDAVVGYIMGTVHRSEGLAVIPAGESYLEIDEVYVSPEHRNAGIGHRLVDRIILEAAGNGIHRSIVHSAAKDWRRIVGFYEKHDFQMWFVQMVR